ncbi:MAG: nucleotidyltransferase [Deltaproteobacteria bacterium]|nr:nucleotidyltransferase [Deltaproteobacteria bacterium]
MHLDLGSLKDAVNALSEAVRKSEDPSFMGQFDVTVRNLIRSGVIQHFEFTYELCWKFIQRWLAVNAPQGESGLPRSRRDLFRMASRHGLIGEPTPWFEAGDARNITSHTYDWKKADIVYGAAVRFLPEASDLLARLEQHND